MDKLYRYGGIGALMVGGYVALDKYVLNVGPKSTVEIANVIPAPVVLTDPASRGKDVPGLDPKEFKRLTLGKVEKVSDNTSFYSFKLADEKVIPNFPLTSYVVCKAEIEGKTVMRPYTPVHTGDPGVMNLMVKSYPTGALSKHFGTLAKGDTLECKGPMPKFPYESNKFKEVYLIAGGTGITPMLQLAEGILGNPADRTRVHLVFANVEEKDILLRSHIEGLAKIRPEQFQVTYALDKPAAGWKGLRGYLDATKLGQLLPKPADSAKVFVCGPPGMMAAVSGSKAPDYTQGELSGALKELGWNKDQVFKF